MIEGRPNPLKLMGYTNVFLIHQINMKAKLKNSE